MSLLMAEENIVIWYRKKSIQANVSRDGVIDNISDELSFPWGVKIVKKSKGEK